MTEAQVTFLFTDIEGSTRLWEHDPGAMSKAMARHDGLCRAAVSFHGGRVVKITGDGVHAVFSEPLAALYSAIEIQRGLTAGEDGAVALRVRSAVHAGHAEERDGDYFGPTVNRAARLADSANPGQVLVSRAVAMQVEAALPAPLGLRSLGTIRLRDLQSEEAVYQLAHPELGESFPPLRSLETTPNNLPSLLTTLVGRRKELAAVRALADRSRLVTLVGAGGIGKTRLALQAAAYQLDRHPDGVWLVELSALSDPALVAQALARVLGERETPGMTTLQVIAERLKGRRTLVVLDNCEHLVDECARLADALLKSAPGLRILATSRSSLDVDGEAIYNVPALAIPDPDFPSGLAPLLEVDAVRLFVERATLHDPDFTVPESDAGRLARIAYRLDGIPLAIELAAARVRTLSLEEIDRGLDDRFGLLTVGSRVAAPRHKTLHALVDWSWRLLTPGARRLYARLAVMAGGWTLASARSVCAEEGGDIDSALEELRDNSLVMEGAAGSERRFRFLDTLREHARLQLEASGEAREAGQRLARYMLRTGEELSPEQGKLAPASLDRLEAELGNLRAALEFLEMDPEGGEAGLRLVLVAWRYWYMRGNSSEGRARVAAALAHPDAAAAPDDLRARVLNCAAAFAYVQGDFHASVELGEQAHAVALRSPTPQLMGVVLAGLAHPRFILEGHAAAKGLYEAAIAAQEAAGQWSLASHNLTNVANNATFAGDLAAAEGYVDRAESIGERFDDDWMRASCIYARGNLAMQRGDHASARDCMERFLALSRSSGDRAREGMALFHLGQALLARGEASEAARLHREAIELLARAEGRLELVNALESAALVAAHIGRADDALRIHEGASVVRERMGFPVGMQARKMRGAVMEEVSRRLDAPKRREVEATLRPMSLAELAALAGRACASVA